MKNDNLDGVSPLIYVFVLIIFVVIPFAIIFFSFIIPFLLNKRKLAYRISLSLILIYIIWIFYTFFL